MKKVDSIKIHSKALLSSIHSFSKTISSIFVVLSKSIQTSPSDHLRNATFLVYNGRSAQTLRFFKVFVHSNFILQISTCRYHPAPASLCSLLGFKCRARNVAATSTVDPSDSEPSHSVRSIGRYCPHPAQCSSLPSLNKFQFPSSAQPVRM